MINRFIKWISQFSGNPTTHSETEPARPIIDPVHLYFKPAYLDTDRRINRLQEDIGTLCYQRDSYYIDYCKEKEKVESLLKRRESSLRWGWQKDRNIYRSPVILHYDCAVTINRHKP